MSQAAKAIVLGASGYLGGHLMRTLGARGIGTYSSRPAAGLVKFDAMTDRLPDLLASAGPVSHAFIPYGAIDPDRCTREPAATMAVNVVSVVRIIEDALRAGVTPVFFSTDYVFKGDRGDWREDEPTQPTTSYGAQKVAVETWLKTRREPWLIVRLSKVVGPETDTHSVIGQWVNDIKAGKAMRIATDQVFSPAAATDIARALVELADGGDTGVWHVAGERFSRYDLLQCLMTEIRRIDPSVTADITACSLTEVPFAEPRPLNTWMNVDRIKARLPWRFRTMQDVCAEAARLHFGR